MSYPGPGGIIQGVPGLAEAKGVGKWSQDSTSSLRLG